MNPSVLRCRSLFPSIGTKSPSSAVIKQHVGNHKLLKGRTDLELCQKTSYCHIRKDSPDTPTLPAWESAGEGGREQGRVAEGGVTSQQNPPRLSRGLNFPRLFSVGLTTFLMALVYIFLEIWPIWHVLMKS